MYCVLIFIYYSCAIEDWHSWHSELINVVCCKTHVSECVRMLQDTWLEQFPNCLLGAVFGYWLCLTKADIVFPWKVTVIGFCVPKKKKTEVINQSHNNNVMIINKPTKLNCNSVQFLILFAKLWLHGGVSYT